MQKRDNSLFQSIDGAFETERLEHFLQGRRVENRIRFSYVPLLAIPLCSLFSAYYFFAVQNPSSTLYELRALFIFSCIASFSLVFLVLLRLFKRLKAFKAADVLIFLYILFLMLSFVTLSVLDSYPDDDTTAVAIFFLSLAFFYRTSFFRIVVLCVAGFISDIAIFSLVNGSQDIIHLLSLFAVLAFAIVISRTQERMHAHLFDVTRKLEVTNHKLQEDSFRDPLTNLYNRRYLEEFLLQQLAGYHRSGQPFSVIMADIDHFKDVNDKYGHPAGDAVLKDIAALMLLHSRDTDLQARYGGEEFLVVLPQTSIAQALLVAERMRMAIASHPFPEIPASITSSFGVAEVQRGDSIESLVKRVDSFLYCAKLAGRNQCVSSI